MCEVYDPAWLTFFLWKTVFLLTVFTVMNVQLRVIQCLISYQGGSTQFSTTTVLSYIPRGRSFTIISSTPVFSSTGVYWPLARRKATVHSNRLQSAKVSVCDWHLECKWGLMNFLGEVRAQACNSALPTRHLKRRDKKGGRETHPE